MPIFPNIDPKSSQIIVQEGVKQFILGETGLRRLTPLSFQEIVAIEGDGRVATSYLGTPVFSNITFKLTDTEGGEVLDLDGNPITAESITINTILMTVTQDKFIVKTPIAGRPGTVKEFISDGDYDIQIAGTLITETTLLNSFKNRYPKEQVKALFDLLRAQTNIFVESEFLQQFGINSVVVDRFTFPQTQGNRDKQLFTIGMSSDTELILQDVETQV